MHLLWVGSLEGAAFSIWFGLMFGGAACFIELALVVWRGRVFPLVWVDGSSFRWFGGGRSSVCCSLGLWFGGPLFH